MTTLETKRALADEARASVQAFNELVNNNDVHPDGFDPIHLEDHEVIAEEYRHERNMELAIQAEMRRLQVRCRELEAEADGAELAYLTRDAAKLGLNLIVDGGRYVVTRDGQVNAVTGGTFEKVAKDLGDMLEGDAEFGPRPAKEPNFYDTPIPI